VVDSSPRPSGRAENIGLADYFKRRVETSDVIPCDGQRDFITNAERRNELVERGEDAGGKLPLGGVVDAVGGKGDEGDVVEDGEVDDQGGRVEVNLKRVRVGRGARPYQSRYAGSSL